MSTLGRKRQSAALALARQARRSQSFLDLVDAPTDHRYAGDLPVAGLPGHENWLPYSGFAPRHSSRDASQADGLVAELEDSVDLRVAVEEKRPTERGLRSRLRPNRAWCPAQPLSCH